MLETDRWSGVDDHRAAVALEAWHTREGHGSKQYAILACRRCGDHGPIAAGAGAIDARRTRAGRRRIAPCATCCIADAADEVRVGGTRHDPVVAPLGRRVAPARARRRRALCPPGSWHGDHGRGHGHPRAGSPTGAARPRVARACPRAVARRPGRTAVGERPQTPDGVSGGAGPARSGPRGGSRAGGPAARRRPRAGRRASLGWPTRSGRPRHRPAATGWSRCGS